MIMHATPQLSPPLIQWLGKLVDGSVIGLGGSLAVLISPTW